MKKLHLVRHAKANAFSKSGKDFDRDLHEKADSQLKLVNQFLKMNNVQVQQVLCSSAKRTRQTLSALTSISDNSKPIFSEDLYLASYGQLLRFVCDKAQGDEIILIGHNEGISELASYLSNQNIYLETANICTINLAVNNWNEVTQGIGKVEVLFSPKEEY